MHYTLALVFAASALAAPLDHEASKSASPSSTISTESPNPSSGASASSGSVANGQRLACDDPRKWPNGGISLLGDAMNMTQNNCLRLKNTGQESFVPNLTAAFYQYNPSTGLVSNSSVTASPDQSNSTCGFLLDVGLLAQVLEAPGGPCDQAKPKLSTLDAVKDVAKIADVKKSFTNLTDLIIAVNNTAFIELSLNALQVDEISKYAKKPVLLTRLAAVYDLMEKTSASSLILARQVDKVLAATFPGSITNLTSVYDGFLQFSANAANSTKPDSELPPPGWCSCSSSSGAVSHTLVSSSTSRHTSSAPTRSTSTHAHLSSSHPPVESSISHPQSTHSAKARKLSSTSAHHASSATTPRATHASESVKGLHKSSSHVPQVTSKTAHSYKAPATSSARIVPPAVSPKPHASTPTTASPKPSSKTSHSPKASAPTSRVVPPAASSHGHASSPKSSSSTVDIPAHSSGSIGAKPRPSASSTLDASIPAMSFSEQANNPTTKLPVSPRPSDVHGVSTKASQPTLMRPSPAGPNPNHPGGLPQGERPERQGGRPEEGRPQSPGPPRPPQGPGPAQPGHSDPSHDNSPAHGSPAGNGRNNGPAQPGHPGPAQPGHADPSHNDSPAHGSPAGNGRDDNKNRV
ncbi:hypothetical protein C8F04DRAFT_687458 [Mycena alexandri]|uniref:Uncharacterized protein n=1 Tax=Mycena alexandri TaxID=1745969 RepID=A0AAD6TF74_9AGAR|nr:hypothetical protein C8F04DRAFT_687458 [Mycena alexandri]